MKAYLPLLASCLSLFLSMIALVGCNVAESTATPTPAETNVVAIPSPTAEMETESATAEPATPAAEPVEPPATPSPAPEMELQVGQWSKLVYHAGLQQVLLVNGGPETGKSPDDPLELWSWDGVRWSLLSADPDGPRWRNFGGVAYDTQRDVLVLVGGLQGRGRRLNDTWEWDGRDWALRSEAEPVGREGAGIVYDAGRGRVVLFGGSDGRAIFQDTWEWDGDSWAQVSNEGPTPRFPAAMVYDETQGRIILYGGHSPTEDNFATNTGDIWAWDGSRWEELAAVEPYPGIRSATALVYEPAKARWLLFGGADNEFHNDTWSWDGRTWTELEVAGPPPRSGHSMVYDEARQRVVLFGGVGRPGGEPLTDMWEWDGEQWFCVFECPEGTAAAVSNSATETPIPCNGHDLVYHAQLEQLLLVNCISEGDGFEPGPGKMWGWDGTQWRLVSDDGPPGRALGGVAYDPTRNLLYIVGGRAPDRDYSDMWTWDGNEWTMLAAGTPGTVSNHFAMVYDHGRDRLVLYGGQDLQERTLDDTWEWDGMQWHKAAESGPSLLVHYALTYDATQRQVLLLGHGPNELWAWDGESWERTSGGQSPPTPPTRGGGRMVYQEQAEQVLLFGGFVYGANGYPLGDTWLWRDGQWTEINVVGPPARSHHGLAYDPLRERVVVYGGYSGDILSDTWEWDGEAWTCVAGCP